MIAQGTVIKVVYIDGAISSGTTRSIRGTVTHEDETSITIQREDGELTIGKNFIIKIENWNRNRGD